MKKCCIISQQGSGTNLLRSFLNSHPDIFIFDEIFTRSEKFTWYKDHGNTVKDYLDIFFETGDTFNKFNMVQEEKGNIPKVFGFDLKYNNIKANPQILDWLMQNDVKILHLYRCKGRTFLRNMNDINKATLTHDQFQDHIKFVSYWENVIKGIFDKGNWKQYQELTYEELTGGRQITSIPNFEIESGLQIFLGVDIKKLTINDKGIREGKLKMRY